MKSYHYQSTIPWSSSHCLNYLYIPYQTHDGLQDYHPLPHEFTRCLRLNICGNPIVDDDFCWANDCFPHPEPPQEMSPARCMHKPLSMEFSFRHQTAVFFGLSRAFFWRVPHETNAPTIRLRRLRLKRVTLDTQGPEKFGYVENFPKARWEMPAKPVYCIQTLKPLIHESIQEAYDYLMLDSSRILLSSFEPTRTVIPLVRSDPTFSYTITGLPKARTAPEMSWLGTAQILLEIACLKLHKEFLLAVTFCNF